jgi:hypothetical protein
MADIILITSAIIITFGLLIKILVTAYHAWGSRPVEIELIPSNDSKSAEKVNLEPYLDIISRQFPEVLDN